jgi:DNA-binding NarL/FixJ family response regulator
MSIPTAAQLVLSEADKKQLMRIGGHRSALQGIVLRVEIVRATAEGMANHAIARKLSTSLQTHSARHVPQRARVGPRYP